MKRTLLLISISLALLPFGADAAECSEDGNTLVYVNGINTDTQEKADRDRKYLADQFKKFTGRTDVTFITGYNPSHLAGLGDLVESVTQAMNKPISNFDLETILNQIHSDVHTRKILLVGHSQGTFYTNELYKYFITHGVPAEAIAVYNLATPASVVAGGGKYLTSSNDKLIQVVRSWAASFGLADPLSDNITISQSADDITGEYGGHSLSTVYLRGAPSRIVNDISNALQSLRADGGETEDCFTPPGDSISHTIGKAAFAVADPAAVGIRSGAIAIGNGATFAGNFASAFVGNAIAQGKAIAGFVSNPTSVLPPANMDTALHGLNVVKVLYGSSVTSADVQDLLYDKPQTNQGSPAVAQKQQHTAKPVQKTSVPETKKEYPPPVQGTVLGASVEVPHNDPPVLPPLSFGGTVPALDSGSPASTATTTAASTVPVATTTPLTAPVFLVDECAHSLSSSFCLIPKNSATLHWSDSGGSIYSVFINNVFSTSTSGLSITIPLAANASSTIEVVAIDSLGTAATSTVVEGAAHPQPIRINEVGWGGTDASASDQWVELKNMTPYTLDLSSLALYAESGAFSIPLSGTLLATDSGVPYQGFITLARNSSVTAAPIGFLLAPMLVLNTAGDALHLMYSDTASTTIDTTPAVFLCDGWCSGSAAQATRFYNGVPSSIEPVSMERLGLGANGTLAGSWASNDTYTSGPLTAQDSLGKIVRGTPGFTNSNHYPLYGWFCSPDTFPITDGQTYHPQGNPCHYLSGFVEDTTQRIGQTFKGDPGNAIALDWHVLQTAPVSSSPYGDTNEPVLFDPSTVLTAGDHLFTAVFARHVVQDIGNFQSYFESASTTGATAPHADYRIVQWVYGN